MAQSYGAYRALINIDARVREILAVHRRWSQHGITFTARDLEAEVRKELLRDPNQFNSVDIVEQAVMKTAKQQIRELGRDDFVNGRIAPLFTLDGMAMGRVFRWETAHGDYEMIATDYGNFDHAYWDNDLRRQKGVEVIMKANERARVLDRALRLAGGRRTARVFDYRD